MLVRSAGRGVAKPTGSWKGAAPSPPHSEAVAMIRDIVDDTIDAGVLWGPLAGYYAKQSKERLTVVESGFDRIPASRRDEAFRMNEGGWAAQSENLRKYVDGQ